MDKEAFLQTRVDIRVRYSIHVNIRIQQIVHSWNSIGSDLFSARAFILIYADAVQG